MSRKSRAVSAMCIRTIFTCCASDRCLPPSLADQAARREHKTQIPGPQVQSFTLRDFRGKSYSLADLQDKQAVVIAFLGTECPLAMQYAPRLVATGRAVRRQRRGLHRHQRQPAGFALRNGRSTPRCTKSSFPLLKDVGNVVADSARRSAHARSVRARSATARFAIGAGSTINTCVGRQRKKADARGSGRRRSKKCWPASKSARPMTEAPAACIGRVHQAKGRRRSHVFEAHRSAAERHCVECHRAGEIAPFALTNYAEVAGWAETIAGSGRRQPHAALARRSRARPVQQRSPAERRRKASCCTTGFGRHARGRPARTCPLRRSLSTAGGCRASIEEIFMSDKAVRRAGRGHGRATSTSSSIPGFTEDKWVQAAECRPGNRGVVHHIILVRPSAGKTAAAATTSAMGF